MPQIQILDGRSDSIHPGSSIQMDKDHLPLLEDQNPVRRSEILSGTGRVKISLTNAVKSLSNVSGREADVTNSSVATRLDITTHSLYAWIKKYGPDSSTHKEQSDAQAEIRRLQKELKRVTDERDILKKAAAYFAKLSD